MAKEFLGETKFIKAFLEAEDKLLTIEWLESSEEMEDDDYREQVDILTEYVKEYQPRLGISEMTNFFFTVDPDIQKELDQKNAKQYVESGLQKLAIVIYRGEADDVDENFEFDFERMSIEQISQEEYHAQVQTHVFPSEKIARKWLFA